MTIVLHYHPYSRAANVVWMLEEAEVAYELHYVDMQAGEQKLQATTALNPMGKLPVLQDGATVVTESAAIGLYLADRYAPGRLAPALDSAERGTYLRWSFFAPSVVEPAAMAKAAGWTYRDGAAGFGTYDAMLNSAKSAISGRDFLLGDRFSMADVIFGGTLGYMLRFKMIDPLPEFVAYNDRLEQRPARQRATAINTKSAADHGLGRG